MTKPFCGVKSRMSQSSFKNPPRDPEYIRVPKLGEREPITGLSRSSIDRLIRPQECNNFKPPVASRCVRIRDNSRRGIRLISLESLLAFLSKQPKHLRQPSKAASLNPPSAGEGFALSISTASDAISSRPTDSTELQSSNSSNGRK